MLSNKIIIILSSITNSIVSIQQLQVGYWFSSDQTPNLQAALPAVTFFSIGFLLGVVTYFYNRFVIHQYAPKNRVLRPFSIGIALLSLAGSVFVFFRYLKVSFLGTRFFIALFMIAVVSWVGYFCYLWRKRVPAEIVKHETRMIKKKYLRKSRL